MSLGASVPWPEALAAVTAGGTRRLSAEPLLAFYAPLQRWLVAENRRRRYPLDWPLP